MATIAEKQGIFFVIDTEIKDVSETFIVSGLNGTQGDDMRKVNLAIKQGTIGANGHYQSKPMNLAGRAVRFAGKDANGKRKFVDGTYEIISEAGGLVTITLPREVYAAHGEYQTAFIEVYDPKGVENTASVKLALTVVQNDVMFTTNPSDDYISRVEDIINTCQETFDMSAKQLNSRVEKFDETLRLQESRAESIQETFNNLIKLIEQGGVPTFGGDNVLTGKNTFLEFIEGFTTGNTVSFYGANQPAQDLNDVATLRNMRSFTTKYEYFSSNKTLNNPTPGDMFYLDHCKSIYN